MLRIHRLHNFKSAFRHAGLLCLWTFAFQSARSQEMWGISNSNYAGNMGIRLNPSTIVAAPYKFDFNLFAYDVFAQNNVMYVSKRYRVIPSMIEGDTTRTRNITIENYKNESQFAFSKALVIAPSAIYNAGKWAVGVHTAFRAEGAIVNVPYFMTRVIMENYKYLPYFGQSFESPHMSSAAMAWSEIGVTYGKVGMKKEKDFLKWAVTLNYLTGYDGIYLDIRKLGYAITDTATANIAHMDATFAHAVPEGTTGSAGDVLSKRGWGLGSTIGATYIHNRKQKAYDCGGKANNLKKYEYRLGVSILDIGRVRFTKNTSGVNLNNSGNPLVWADLNKTKFNSFPGFDSTLADKIGGTISKGPIYIWLPTALSVQFDYSLSPRFYANASLVQRVHFAGNQIARGNQTVLALRYERRLFETAINASLFEYSQPGLGATIRYGFLVIGSDRVGDIMGWQNMKSVDVYLGIKFNFCELQRRAKHNHSCPAYKSNLGGSGKS